MKRIPLTQGKFALVDDGWFEYLNQWKWFFHQGAAARFAAIEIKKRKMILMHRLITTAPNGFDVDHKDGNRLNNQEDNLRVCSHQQNSMNRRKIKHNKTGYKGVRPTSAGRFQAIIGLKGKTICLGTFDSPKDAALAYDKAAPIYHGEFARLNFPL